MPLTDGLSVYVATPCIKDIPVQTVCAYLDTQETCLKYGIEIDIGFITGSLVHHARTLAANIFLKGKHQRLFWIDADIVWTPEDFLRLLIHSRTRECVVGIYPRRADPPAYYVRFMPDSEPNDEGLVSISGTGLGFACIQRKVIEQLAEKAPKLQYAGTSVPVPSIFRQDDADGEARGEDYAFWADVRALGYEIWADTMVNLGHIGNKVYRMRLPPPMPSEGQGVAQDGNNKELAGEDLHGTTNPQTPR